MKLPVAYSKENIEKCICKNCPSYNDCMGERNQGLFCAMGRTHCEFERKGCICGDCPIAKEYNLNMSYWCLPTTCAI